MVTRKLILLLCCFVLTISAQTIEIVKTVQLRLVDKVSYDRYFNLYISDLEGTITKYNQEGDSLLAYSPSKTGSITSLEAWNTIRVFAFYKDFQQFGLFDRFLGPLPKIDLPEEQIGFGRIATVSANNQIWFFDDSDFSLKKYDTEQLKVISKTNCDLILNAQDYDLVMMKEYQNQLFVLDRINGILVFDNFGNFKKKITIPALEYFGFYKDELYYLDGSELILLKIYLDERRTISLPKNSYGKAVMGEKYIYLFDKSNLEVFRTK